jgi:hypothetical protein
MLGAAALVLVGIWASSSPQEIVRVEEMSSPQSQPIPEHAPSATSLAPAPLDGKSLANLTAAVPAAAVPESEATSPAGRTAPTATDPVPGSGKSAQAIAPVVPNAAVGARTRETLNKTPRTSARRHRDAAAGNNVARGAASSVHLPDVIPNPYHN